MNTKFLISSILALCGIFFLTKARLDNNQEIELPVAFTESASPGIPLEKLMVPLRTKIIEPAPTEEIVADFGAVDSNKELINNWNLQDTDLPAETLGSFFEYNQPERIVYFNNNEIKHILPEKYAGLESQTNQTLFIGDTDAIKKTADEREQRSKDLGRRFPEPAEAREEEQTLLEHNAFEVVFFKPGKRDNGEAFVPLNNDLISTLQGPDYSFQNVSATDEFAMQKLLSTVLSLGHGGEILLQIKNEGYLLDKYGFDFMVFENAFRIAGTKLMFQEFAYVGVSESRDAASFVWFPCDPLKKILWGCAGAVPTAEGGDQFDLSELKLDKIKYIWIKDIGKNYNRRSKWPTEGVDLDTVRLNHAYRNK